MQDKSCLSKAVCLVHVRISAFCVGFEPPMDYVNSAQQLYLSMIVTTLVGW